MLRYSLPYAYLHRQNEKPLKLLDYNEDWIKNLLKF